MHQKQETYILSPFYHLPEVQECIDFEDIKDDHPETIQGLLTGGSYLLHHLVKDRLYIINPTIQYFLTLFNVERTPNEIVELVAKEGNCSPHDIAPTIEEFAKSMLKRNILVPSVKLPEIVAFKEKFDNKEPVLKVGETISGYTIKEELAMRGKLELYIAERPDGLGECVLKVLYMPEDLPEKKRVKAKKSFYQEFLFMKELDGHPGVCTLYEIIKDARVPMASMERIQGKSVKGWLRDQEISPTIEDKVKVLVQVTDAIAWAQKKGIFHGDIHSGNFLVHQGKVKLIDFDLANRETPNKDEILRKGGVYEYIAPECLRTSSFGWLKKEANHRSEVYQLGIIIYFVMYGHFPFTAITWAGLADKILNTPAQFLSKDVHGNVIPSKLMSICQKCLKKNPDSRYQSATTLNQQLVKLQKEIDSSKAIAQ